MLGGLGSLAGAVWGSLLLVLVPTYLTDVATSHGLSGAASSSVPIAAYGVVLIVVMLAFPGGIQGGLRRLLGFAVPAGGEPPGSRSSVLRRHAPAREHQEKGTNMKRIDRTRRLALAPVVAAVAAVAMLAAACGSGSSSSGKSGSGGSTQLTASAPGITEHRSRSAATSR